MLDFHLYPNPIKKTATLEYTFDQPEILTIQLKDLHGRVLKAFLEEQSPPAGMHTQLIILPTDLPKGMHLVKMLSPNGHIFIKIIR